MSPVTTYINLMLAQPELEQIVGLQRVAIQVEDSLLLIFVWLQT